MPSAKKRPLIPLFFGALALVAAALAFEAAHPRAAEAQAPVPDVKQVQLPAGQRLKDANWHCWAGGSCELWVLTKPRKAEEKPETYVFSNADGTRKYVIKEQ